VKRSWKKKVSTRAAKGRIKIRNKKKKEKKKNIGKEGVPFSDWVSKTTPSLGKKKADRSPPRGGGKEKLGRKTGAGPQRGKVLGKSDVHKGGAHRGTFCPQKRHRRTGREKKKNPDP